MGLIPARVILSEAKRNRTFAVFRKSASACHEAGSRTELCPQYRRSRAARALLRSWFLTQDDTGNKTGDTLYVNLLLFVILLSFPLGAAGDVGEDDTFF